MHDSNVAMMYERFTWRMLANPVSPWEFEQITGRIASWDDWCGVWSTAAAEHVKRGDEAAAAGNGLTAGDAYVRAASFYHWATFYFVHDQRQFTAALEAAADAMRKAAVHVRPHLEIVSIPFEGAQLPAHRRLAHRRLARWPLRWWERLWERLWLWCWLGLGEWTRL